MDGLIGYINKTYRELATSRYSSKKAWNLVTALTHRILEDVYKPRDAVLRAIRTKHEIQVACVMYHASLKSHEIMREYMDLKFSNHSSTSSEDVKFLYHNTSYELA